MNGAPTYQRVTDPKRVIPILRTPEDWRGYLQDLRCLAPRNVAVIESHVCALENRLESLERRR